MSIALALGFWNRTDLQGIDRALQQAVVPLRLLVLPEGFLPLQLPATAYDRFWDAPQQHLATGGVLAPLQALAVRHRLDLIAGIRLAPQDATLQTAVNGAAWDQAAVHVGPDGRLGCVYHKHGVGARSAFFDDGWSPGRAVPTVRLATGDTLALTLCNDMFLSPLVHAGAQQGARLWANPSFQNVRNGLWSAMLQARAYETGMTALCPLFRNPHAANPQDRVFAIAPGGNLPLLDAGSAAPLESCPAAARADRLYRIAPGLAPQLPQALPHAPIPRAATGLQTGLEGAVRGAQRSVQRLDIALDDLLHRPEKLWLALLDRPDATPILQADIAGHPLPPQPLLDRLLAARAVEFSGLVLLHDGGTIRQACWRSSNYKHVRHATGAAPQIALDDRFLFGPIATLRQTMTDRRATLDGAIAGMTALARHVAAQRRPHPHRRAAKGLAPAA